MSFKITRFKQKLIFLTAIIAFAGAILIQTFHQTISAWSWWQQFAVIGAMGYILPSVAVGSFFERPVKKTIGLILFLFAVDLILPPYLVSLEGKLTDGVLLSGSAVDSFVFHIHETLLNGLVSGFPMFVLVYPITSLVLLVVAVMFLADEDIRGVVA